MQEQEKHNAVKPANRNMIVQIPYTAFRVKFTGADYGVLPLLRVWHFFLFHERGDLCRRPFPLHPF
jgi:hypothetical protein